MSNHQCPACRHGNNKTLNDALALGSEYLKSFNNGYACGFKDASQDEAEAAEIAEQPDNITTLVKLYTGTVVSAVARALAVIAIDTRPDDDDSMGEAARTVLRVTEAARLLCAVAPDQPYKFLTAKEQADLRSMCGLYIVPPEEAPDVPAG